VLFISNNQKILGESEFVLTLFGAMAQEESANLSKRVKFGKRITAGRGRVPTRVFGYDRVDNYTLTINEDEAAVVRAIFAHYLSGLGCRRIANELNSRGAKTKLGCDWDARGVRRILENSIYCGRYVNRKFEVTDFIEGTLKKLPTDENLLHLRPEWAIVSADTFSQATETRAARANLYKNANPYTGGRHSTRHMFSTIIHCAHCGRSFTRKSGEFWKCTTNDQRGSRICDNNTAVDERQLAQALSDFLSNIIGDRSELSARVSAKMQAAVTCDSSVADERARARQVRASARYREMFAAELISMDELKKALSKIEQNLVQLTPKPNPPSFNADAAIDDFFEMTNVENIDIRRLVQKICVSRKREAEIFIGE
ncbi:MAG: recombinase family protein, partial [Clostridia bacterium]